MHEYEIYINFTPVLGVDGAEAAYTKFEQACDLFEGTRVLLVCADTAEVVADSDDLA